ncbi:MAG: hypothetical protein COZ28_00890 [Candidatus Moranbacteria bacterium CG_4_10_14_3_um_filter_44_15]|nr:MAG: hypothetical protein COS72_01600 [Candidatus Moranbacteria bacterium CG06_land_8_20_14_3_00_43_56]PIV84516.1 MAG: hypothetical protein COW51_00130 [Candidatus Moranbacteria bacterium CG17_big_fil_post_rev_8_21_14_2_50_44_12]PIW93249.1 MAG: hypothetical protein COZ87_02365 [Candidatus Moranbacteria bacterium CG_4_8_14_3_um_filter_43_15]PIX91004.1 MAG: hypothetical protein COZ28_00890 [Candidatus Moranbacteria bacterium CG_4_10_14_3_um_filter_44_15]PJA86258.1 MAG: hypothetical protein CO1
MTNKQAKMQVIRNMVNLRGKTEVIQKIPVKSDSVRLMIGALLAPLSAKQKLVISSRFGISGGKPQTLEAIGKTLGITRERVRQIESGALDNLQKSQKGLEANATISLINEIVAAKGGIVRADTLVREVASQHPENAKENGDKEKNQLIELVFPVAGLKKVKGNRELHDSWADKNFNSKKFQEVVDVVERFFEDNKKLHSGEDLVKKLEYTELLKKNPDIAPGQVLNFLEVSKKFDKNVFGNWGKAKWPLVRPRGVREKATLVLLNQKKPLHFREISRLIENFGLSRKKVHSQTVHNELIRDKRFVLVGRGTYALREWGYEEGTVKDVIVSLLKSAGGFLSKENIISGVLGKRKVKKATIAVNLADKNTFSKKADGYGLR